VELERFPALPLEAQAGHDLHGGPSWSRWRGGRCTAPAVSCASASGCPVIASPDASLPACSSCGGSDAAEVVGVGRLARGAPWSNMRVMTRLLDQIREALAAFRGGTTTPALIGGLALAAHQVVRATQDVDFLVD